MLIKDQDSIMAFIQTKAGCELQLESVVKCDVFADQLIVKAQIFSKEMYYFKRMLYFKNLLRIA
jgi:hypothetical protein